MCARGRRSKYLSYLQPYFAREFSGGMEKKKGKIKTAKATEEEDDDDSESRLMMHKAAKQLLAGPQRAGVLSFCVCAPCSWEERKLKRRRRDHWVVFFFFGSL